MAPRDVRVKVVVIGGSGLIGSRVVARLEAAGHAALAASPRSGVDALTGRGLARAFDGASVVIDASNAPRHDPSGAMAYFTTATRRWLEHAALAGANHVVALSVVGVRANHASPYLRAKHAQEALIRQSGLPYSIVRSTQFFEFLPRIAEQAVVSSEVRVPQLLVRPVAADDVANTIASVALHRPTNGIVELAGPEEFPLDEIIGRVLRDQHDSRPVVADPGAEYFGARLPARALLPDGTPHIGLTSFDSWRRLAGGA